MWSLPRRIAFRFLACYFLLYSLPEGGRAGIFSYANFLFKPYIAMWHAICPWVAIHVFHLSGKAVTYFPTGSGDTTLAYIANLLYVVISAAVAIAWSVLDRKRGDYRTLEMWLRLLVRYTLAFTLLGYGFAKVFPLQFQPAQFNRLMQPFGEFSPMGVLWSFMGASQPYTIFAGVCEVVPGLLLLMPRTATLGALVGFAVMLNVMVLNFCYDVPVKLYSANLVLMSLYLASADLGRLWNFFVRNETVEPANLPSPVFGRRWMRIGAVVFQVALVGFTLVGGVVQGWMGYSRAYLHPMRPPLYGLYDVESNFPRWRKLAVTQYSIAVRTMEDRTQFFQAKYDEPKKQVTLNEQSRLTWSFPSQDILVLEGDLYGEKISVRLRRVDGRIPLLTRGFHWINEMPFNR